MLLIGSYNTAAVAGHPLPNRIKRKSPLTSAMLDDYRRRCNQNPLKISRFFAMESKGCHGSNISSYGVGQGLLRQSLTGRPAIVE
jgi:hypothetical protein